jgi:hypothetical protein
MATSEARVVDYPVQRLDVALPDLYDAAVRRYEELVPAVEMPRHPATWDAVVELAAINAPHGFMIYWKTDVTAIMAPLAGWKCTEYLMGNHVIAERMFRHEPGVMLYAPLRTVIYADSAGDTHFAVDRPSAHFASYGNDEIAKVGRELDLLVLELAGLLGASGLGDLGW